MDVLQGDEIHEAIELVVSRKEVLEGFVFIVVRIAVAGSEVVFQTNARCPGRLRKGISTKRNKGIGLMFEARIRERGSGGVVEMPVLSHQLERVIPRTQFARI